MSEPRAWVMKRRPTHPGEMLLADFMPDVGLSIVKLATTVGVSRQSINELLRGRRGVSPDMALRLARVFGNSPEFWLNAQRAVDLWDAAQPIKAEMARIKLAATRGARKKATGRVAERPDPGRDAMRPEYDFSKGVRGATAARYRAGTNLVLLDPDVHDLFPDSTAVNEALRTFARLMKPRRASR